MGSSKTKSSYQQQQKSNQTQVQTTPGEPWQKDVLSYAEPLKGQVAAQTGFSGDRVQAPAPITQDTQTYYQPAVDAGLANAQGASGWIDPMTSGLKSYWTDITGGGGQNPYTQNVIDSWTTDFNEQAQKMKNQRALTAGAEGAFGGTPFQQGEAWAAEQESQAYGRTLADLRYQDFLNTQELMKYAPTAIGQIAQASNLPAEMLGQWGGQKNFNAREADDRQTAIGQAGMDNEFARWLSEQEALQSQIANYQGLSGLGGMIGGGTTTSEGTSETSGTQTTKSTPSLGQTLASLGGMALTALGGPMGAAGGLFSGSANFMKGLGGALPYMPMPATANIPSLNSMMPQMPNWRI